MENKTLEAFASILEDWYDDKLKRYYEALNIEYCSKSFQLTTNDLNEALEEFQENNNISEFADRNKPKTIYPYVRVEGDPTVYRLGEYLSSIGTDD